MISNYEAIKRRDAKRTPRWGNETLEQAVIRLDREIRAAADNGSDGTSLCFAPEHIPVLKIICDNYGFSVSENKDEYRLCVNWTAKEQSPDQLPDAVPAVADPGLVG